MTDTSPESSGSGVKRKTNDEQDLSLTGPINRFASNLYKAINNDKHSSNNVLFSPFLHYSLVGMMALGTRGISRKEIFQLLGAPLSPAEICAAGDTISNDDFGSRYKSLMDSFKGDDAKKLRTGLDDYSGSRAACLFTLVTAPKIYMQSGDGLKFNPYFAGDVKQYFDVDPEVLDFSKRRDAVKHINNWMATATENKIPEIVSENSIKDNTKLIFVNGMYFKAVYKNHFVLQEGLENFNVSTSKQVKVQMMSFEDHYYHRDLPDLDARALAVPYKGERMYMIIILPNQIDGLKKVQEGIQDVLEIDGKSRLTIDSMDCLLLVSLKMPKYQIESSLGNLKIIVEKWGLESILSSRKADFSGIGVSEGEDTAIPSNKPAHLLTCQIVVIDVNELDTEAAVSTSMGTDGRSDPPTKLAPFYVDRPYYYQIVDHKNDDLVLFAGHVTDPTQ